MATMRLVETMKAWMYGTVDPPALSYRCLSVFATGTGPPRGVVGDLE